MGYFDKDPSEYDYRAFDIETTGFAASDTLTTFTLEDDGMYHIWVNTDGREMDVPESVNTIREESGEECRVYAAEDEEELLLSVENYMDTHFTDNTILVAYNGETWKGGFDLQFLRTACINNNVGWILKGMKYLDIYPIFGKKDRFNTTVPSHKGMSKDQLREFADWLGVDYDDNIDKTPLQYKVADTNYDFPIIYDWADENNIEEIPTYNYNDQVGIHQALTDEIHTYDPWTNSKYAVDAFHDGEFVPLVLHNLADVVKTKELTQMAVDCVSADDFSLKTL